MFRSIMAAFITAVLLAPAGAACAAPGRSDDAAGAARQAKPMQREEQKAREEIRRQAPDEGAREQAREERSEREIAEGKGAATSQEMQARREERKQIQEAYRESSGEGPGAQKKPWWKFWASDDGAD